MTDKRLMPSLDKPWLKYYSAEALAAPLPECTAYELIYRNNKDHLSDLALNYYGRRFTYAELFAGIEAAAKAFAAAGVKKGDTVILCAVNMPETLYILYGLCRLGATVNLIDPRTNSEQLRRYINECAAKLAVTVEPAYPIIKKAAEGSTAEQLVIISPADSLPAVKRLAYRIKNKPPKTGENTFFWADFVKRGAGAEPEYAPYEKGRCFIIAHTGGTTGEPKGVMLSDDNINAVTHCYRYLGIPFERQQTYFNDLPPFIIYGLTIAVHTTLSYGQQVILYPVFDSKDFPRQFRKYKPNHFSALPDHLIYLAKDRRTANMDMSFLITPAVGGDSLNNATECAVNMFLKRSGCKYEIVKGYGMTELGATGITSFDGANAIGSVGIPLVKNNVRITDIDTGEELPCGQTGELWISGPSVMLGYYNNPEATAEVLIKDSSGVTWVRTGDLARVDENGLVYHEGRLRRIYLTAFEGQPAKIFPMLIERAVKEAEAVYDCVAVARHMKGSVYFEPVAFVQKAENVNIPDKELIEELEALCSERLPTYMRPVEYRFVESFPHTPIGKIDFRALEKLAAEE